MKCICGNDLMTGDGISGLCQNCQNANQPVNETDKPDEVNEIQKPKFYENKRTDAKGSMFFQQSTILDALLRVIDQTNANTKAIEALRPTAPGKCRVCGGLDIWRNGLKRHCELCGYDWEAGKLDDPTPDKPQEGPLQCLNCARVFSKSKPLKKYDADIYWCPQGPNGCGSPSVRPIPATKPETPEADTIPGSVDDYIQVLRGQVERKDKELLELREEVAIHADLMTLVDDKNREIERLKGLLAQIDDDHDVCFEVRELCRQR